MVPQNRNSCKLMEFLDVSSVPNWPNLCEKNVYWGLLRGIKKQEMWKFYCFSFPNKIRSWFQVCDFYNKAASDECSRFHGITLRDGFADSVCTWVLTWGTTCITFTYHFKDICSVPLKYYRSASHTHRTRYLPRYIVCLVYFSAPLSASFVIWWRDRTSDCTISDIR